MAGQLKEINDALIIIDRILPLLSESKGKLKSARNWGFFDVLGGGLLTDIVKHSKINSASRSMNEVSRLLGELKRELGDINFPSDYKMNVGGFSTFADFFFDGIFADAYMQGKIFDSIDTVNDLENRLYQLRGSLVCEQSRSIDN